MLIAAGAGGRVHPPGYHSQKQTRRDITDQRIMQNILQFNSPVISKDFSNLRLGPLKGGPKYHHRSPPVMNSKDFSLEQPICLTHHSLRFRMTNLMTQAGEVDR